MAKKQTPPAKKPFNFGNSPLVQKTEETVTNGYNQIEQKEKGRGDKAKSQQVNNQQAPQKRLEKEATQAMLVHCPVSLHARLSRLKTDTFELTGQRMTLNDMTVQAIEYWLDAQQKK